MSAKPGDYVGVGDLSDADLAHHIATTKAALAVLEAEGAKRDSAYRSVWEALNGPTLEAE